MTDHSDKRRRRSMTRWRGRPLPWSDPTVGDVYEWLIEALDNVAEATNAAPRQLGRAEDAACFMEMLQVTAMDPAYDNDLVGDEVYALFWRSQRLLETLLDADRLSGSSSEQACTVKIAEKLGSVMMLIMSCSVISIRSIPEIIAGIRRAALAAARYCVSAGATATLERRPGGGGTAAAAHAAQLAGMLYRHADDREKFLGTLH